MICPGMPEITSGLLKMPLKYKVGIKRPKTQRYNNLQVIFINIIKERIYHASKSYDA